MIAGHALIFCFEEHFNIIFGFWSYIQVVQHSSLYFYNGLLSYTYAKKIKVTTHECRYAAKYKWVPRRNVYHKKIAAFKNVSSPIWQLPLAIANNNEFLWSMFFYKDDAFDLIRLYKQKNWKICNKIATCGSSCIYLIFWCTDLSFAKVITAPSSWVR